MSKNLPIDPTSSMVIAGFEAVSEFQETDYFKKLSGCRGAAESARVCWIAMANQFINE